MDVQIQEHANNLYIRSRSEAANELTDQLTSFATEMGRRGFGHGFSGIELGGMARIYADFIGRLMTARLNSFREAFHDASATPSAEDLDHIWGQVRELYEREPRSCEARLAEYAGQRGAPSGASVNLTAAVAHHHDRVLQEWRVWRGKTNLDKSGSNRSLVFISCGQYQPREKELGQAIVRLLKEFGFEGYFAENQSTFQALVSNVLRKLDEVGALIVVMHPRGVVQGLDNEKHERASVWIEQEIAIAAFLQAVYNRPLKVAAYVHKSIQKREGVREQLQLNPHTFESDQEVLDDLRTVLPKWQTLRVKGTESR